MAEAVKGNHHGPRNSNKYRLHPDYEIELVDPFKKRDTKGLEITDYRPEYAGSPPYAKKTYNKYTGNNIYGGYIMNHIPHYLHVILFVFQKGIENKDEFKTEKGVK